MQEIKLIVLDVDGTLTDGKIYYDSNGNEMKSFNVKDGMVIGQAIKNGIEVVIITGRKSAIIDRRAEELGIRYVCQGVHNKLECLEKVLCELNLEYRDSMYIGDDINDLNVMKKVSVSACPNDAAKEVKELSSFNSKYNGGEGAVREIIEEVLKVQGKWEKIVDNYSWITQ